MAHRHGGLQHRRSLIRHKLARANRISSLSLGEYTAEELPDLAFIMRAIVAILDYLYTLNCITVLRAPTHHRIDGNRKPVLVTQPKITCQSKAIAVKSPPPCLSIRSSRSLLFLKISHFFATRLRFSSV